MNAVPPTVPDFTAWSVDDPRSDPRLRFEIGSITKVFTGEDLLRERVLAACLAPGAEPPGPALALAKRPA